jgi:hypothetical protein
MASSTLLLPLAFAPCSAAVRSSASGPPSAAGSKAEGLLGLDAPVILDAERDKHVTF